MICREKYWTDARVKREAETIILLSELLQGQ
jgi:hypothetical protein